MTQFSVRSWRLHFWTAGTIRLCKTQLIRKQLWLYAARRESVFYRCADAQSGVETAACWLSRLQFSSICADCLRPIGLYSEWIECLHRHCYRCSLTLRDAQQIAEIAELRQKLSAMVLLSCLGYFFDYFIFFGCLPHQWISECETCFDRNAVYHGSRFRFYASTLRTEFDLSHPVIHRRFWLANRCKSLKSLLRFCFLAGS